MDDQKQADVVDKMNKSAGKFNGSEFSEWYEQAMDCFRGFAARAFSRLFKGNLVLNPYTNLCGVAVPTHGSGAARQLKLGHVLRKKKQRQQLQQPKWQQRPPLKPATMMMAPPH